MSDHDSWTWVRDVYHATPAAEASAAHRVADLVALELAQKPTAAPQSSRASADQRKALFAYSIAGAAAAALLLVVALRSNGGNPNDQEIGPRVASVGDSVVEWNGTPVTDSVASDSVSRPASAKGAIAADDHVGQRAVAARTDSGKLAAARTWAIPSTSVDTAASSVVAQTTGGGAIDARSAAVLRAHLSETAFARLEALVDSTASRELPTAPVIDRAVQGVRRRLSNDIILNAATGVADRLAKARMALGRESTTDELIAGAEALFAGVTPATLIRVRSIRPAGRTVVPLIVLTDLVTNGVPVDDATAAVLSLVNAPHHALVAASDETMLTIRAEVAADVARGATPATALSSRVRSHTRPERTPNRPTAPIPPGPSLSAPTTRPPGGL